MPTVADFAESRAWTPNPGETTVGFTPNPNGAGGYFVTNQGGILAVGGAPSPTGSGGSYLGGTRQFDEARSGARTFTGIEASATGVTLVATSGERYTYDFSPRTPVAPPAENLSARAQLDATLGQFGLSGLGGWAWEKYKAGVPVEQIFLDLRQTPEYKARFPAMEALAKKGRAVSEATYIDLERTFAQTRRAAGLPEGFYDRPEDFAKLIAGEVSPTEDAARVELARLSAFQAPPEVRDELARNYGIDAGQLTAYWLDPDRALPLIQQQYLSAQIGGQARTTGYGVLTKSESESLAARGVTEAQAQQGFGQLAESRGLFNALPGSGEDEIGREEQIGAVFAGNAGASERIRRRQAQRKAEFGGGGGFSSSREGVGGLGSAR